MFSYPLDPNINKKKFLELTPPSDIDFSKLPTIPENWLKQLEDRCRERQSTLEENCFQRHMGNNYSTLSELLRGLKVIYYRLFGYLDSSLGPLLEEDAIIFKLTEDINKCTPGFQNRVNDILLSLSRPRDLGELVYQMRVELVKNLAIQHTQEIHAWNQVTQIAANLGLIQANFAKDPYLAKAENETIKSSLQKEFEKKYTSFTLPVLLAEQLRSQLIKMGYKGFQQDGYSAIEKLAEGIRPYLSEKTIEKYLVPELAHKVGDKKDEYPSQTVFFIISGVVDDSPIFQDFDWKLIKRCILLSLADKGYFNKEPAKEDIYNILSLACFSEFFSDENTSTDTLSDFEWEYIKRKLFDGENYLELESAKIYSPIFWQKLRSSSRVIQLFIEELKKNLSGKKNDATKKIEILFTLNWKGFIDDKTIDFDLLAKSMEINLKERSLANYRPGVVGSILQFIKKKIELFDQTTLREMFSETTADGWNALMMAARYHLGALTSILEFVKLPNLFDQTTLREMFSETTADGWNALMIAARYQPKALTSILKLITEFSELFDQTTLQKMFLRTTVDGWSALTMAASYHPETLISILDYLTKNPKIFNQTVLRQMFSETTADGWNALMLAARYHLGALTSILEFVKRPDLFDKTTLRKMFSKTTVSGLNTLMLAARYQPEALTSILKLITEFSKLFDQTTLQEMLLRTTVNGWSALTIAASHHPETLISILDYLTKNPKIFNQAVLQQMFSETTAEGWNALMSAARIQNVLESVQNFIIDSALKLDKKILTIFLQPDMAWNSSLAPAFLKKYLNELSMREEQNITHTTKFFGYNFGYSTKEEKDAAQALEKTLVSASLPELEKLEANHPALQNGRLSILFTTFRKLKVDNPSYAIEFNCLNLDQPLNVSDLAGFRH